ANLIVGWVQPTGIDGNGCGTERPSGQANRAVARWVQPTEIQWNWCVARTLREHAKRERGLQVSAPLALAATMAAGFYVHAADWRARKRPSLTAPPRWPVLQQ